MKYIRTKDGIFEVTDSYKVGAGFIKYEVKNALCIADFEIIKQADTIEELCDAFIVKFRNLIINIYYDFEYEIPKEYKNDSNNIIYGAIWIKGEHGEPILKSVAKMNDKGELKLL